jgi:hypothetical protein
MLRDISAVLYKVLPVGPIMTDVDRGGPTKSPLFPPDLNPLDFHL